MLSKLVKMQQILQKCQLLYYLLYLLLILFVVNALLNSKHYITRYVPPKQQNMIRDYSTKYTHVYDFEHLDSETKVTKYMNKQKTVQNLLIIQLKLYIDLFDTIHK